MMARSPLKLVVVSMFLALAVAVAVAQKPAEKVPETPAQTAQSQPSPNNETSQAVPQVTPAAPAQTQASPSPNESNDRLPFMSESEHLTQDSSPGIVGLLLRTLGALLLIVGLIVAVSWAIKRFAGARFGGPKDDSPQLSLLNTLSLGDKRSIAVVRFGTRTLLVGSTPQTVTLLAEEDQQDDYPTTPRSVADFLKDEEEPVDFSHELASATAQLSAKNDPGTGVTA